MWGKYKIHLIKSATTCSSQRTSYKVDLKWIHFQRNQRAKLRLHSVGPIGLQKSAMLNPLVKSHWGCRLTPGQMSFHGRNEDVWPNPLFPLIKMDISELSEGEVWVFRDSRWLLADSGLPFPIGSISPVALPPTVWYSGLPMSPEPAQPWQAVHFSLNGTHTNLLRLYTVLGPRCNSHVPAEKIYH